jgi:hypothetical protein
MRYMGWRSEKLNFLASRRKQWHEPFVADKPVDSSRREKTAKASKSLDRSTSERSTSAVATSLAEASRPPFFTPNVVWALVAGLAVGFAAGREAYRLGGMGGLSSQAAPDSSAAAFIAADTAPSRGYAKESEFPADWVKSTDLTNADSILAGLDAAQKTKVMQALNERDCTCGCPFGKLATCLQKDPNCPNSPAIAKIVVGLVKQGKSLDELLAAIDDKQSGNKKPQAAPEAPKGPQYIALADFNLRKGPKDPKVTIVEFSDFQ